MTIDYWLTVGLVAILGALVGASTTAWSVTRNIKHKSVIEERQKWRELLRELVPEFVTSEDDKSRVRIRDSIVLRLNPYKDEHAIELLDDYLKNPSRSSGESVVTYFQELLKFDWERAKIEASFRPLDVDWRAHKKVKRQKKDQEQRKLSTLNQD